MIRIGTAGWSIPKAVADRFDGPGPHLARYARILSAAEINSSFYRPHRRSTYARWAATVPPDFRFSVKVPKAISHIARLADAAEQLDAFVAQIDGLGEALGVVLLQLPPSLAFDAATADAFLSAMRARLDPRVGVACEPRHASWFTPTAEACLITHRIARVAADPPVAPGGDQPGGWPGLHYYRLHGTPRIYYSAYDPPRLAVLARTMEPHSWCIFDNTASGAAIENALALSALLRGA